MNSMHNIMAAAMVVWLGMADTIVDGWVSAEVRKPSGAVEYFYIPAEVFPCELTEGDMFYAVQVDGVTEIRCGEPEPS